MGTTMSDPYWVCEHCGHFAAYYEPARCELCHRGWLTATEDVAEAEEYSQIVMERNCGV